jgi:hypothetical protein
MAELKDVVLYLGKHYPHPHELSKARLTKMVYLADWRSALSEGHQITNIDWEFNHFGPYVRDVENVARRDPNLTITPTTSLYGAPKELIAARPDAPEPTLTDDERDILDFVIKQTSKLYWNDFIELVYSTYPVRENPKYAHLDLVKLAREYLSIRRAEAT